MRKSILKCLNLHKPLKRVNVQSYLLGIVDHSQYLKIREVAYKLALPKGCRVHPVFHVGRLKRKLGDDDNLIGDEVLVELIEPSTLPHEPEKVLDIREKRTRHSIFQDCLVKWKNKPEESSTWEMVSTLQRRFPNFVFEDANLL